MLLLGHLYHLVDRRDRSTAFSEAWADEVMRERILWAARTTESDPRMRAVSAHLLAVTRVS